MEMVVIALGFIYPNKLENFVKTELSNELIESYRDDLDFQNIIDLGKMRMMKIKNYDIIMIYL